MRHRVAVSSPSRLHFGLAAFAPTATRRGYGGVGVMVDVSRVCLTFESASQFTVVGDLNERVSELCRDCAASWRVEIPNVRITIENLPLHHSGLGLGTQLALNVARGLAAVLERPDPTAIELAKLTGRGQRSAVGTHGNLVGGLIVDGGKGVDDSVGQLQQRVALCDEWRFLLARPTEGQGVSGETEARAFAKLPPVDAKITSRLRQLASDEIVPACRAGDFERFAESVSQYGQIAGSCFAPVQGGLFASPEIAKVAKQLTAAGALGVGQSSWGPTLFGMAPTAEIAAEIASTFRLLSDATIQIAAADNFGMRITQT